MCFTFVFNWVFNGKEIISNPFILFYGITQYGIFIVNEEVTKFY